MNVVITGASRGIGKAIAEIFASNGHSIFLCSRGEVQLYKTMEELQTKYPAATIKAKPCDLGIKEQANEFAQWVLQTAVPDILVNNAGGFEPGSIYNEPEGTLEKMMTINLYGAYHLTRSLLPEMMKEPTEAAGRHIFNICSIAALKAYANGGSYSISKYAMHGFSKNLREEMKPYNIKVTAVFPGAVLTDSWGDFDNAAHRIMEVDDIAKLIYTSSQLSPAACVEDIVVRPQLGDL